MLLAEVRARRVDFADTTKLSGPPEDRVIPTPPKTKQKPCATGRPSADMKSTQRGRPDAAAPQIAVTRLQFVGALISCTKLQVIIIFRICRFGLRALWCRE